MRSEERVTPLELFFDLVFVLALTQCTALMADDPTWEGLAKGLLVLGVLWWAWVGYAWLTSVVDPEEGVVRLAIFAAMGGAPRRRAAVPEAFGDSALVFASPTASSRAQIVLFDDREPRRPGLRHSVHGLAISTAVGVGPARGRVVHRRRPQVSALGAGARARHGRADFFGTERLEARAPATSRSATG